MSNQITVEHKGNSNTYTSIASAWRDLSPANLPLITVRWRLKEGWDAWDAFKYPPVQPKVRRVFKDLRMGYKK